MVSKHRKVTGKGKIYWSENDSHLGRVFNIELKLSKLVKNQSLRENVLRGHIGQCSGCSSYSLDAWDVKRVRQARNWRNGEVFCREEIKFKFYRICISLHIYERIIRDFSWLWFSILGFFNFQPCPLFNNWVWCSRDSIYASNLNLVGLEDW